MRPGLPPRQDFGAREARAAACARGPHFGLADNYVLTVLPEPLDLPAEAVRLAAAPETPAAEAGAQATGFDR